MAAVVESDEELAQAPVERASGDGEGDDDGDGPQAWTNDHAAFFANCCAIPAEHATRFAAAVANNLQLPNPEELYHYVRNHRAGLHDLLGMPEPVADVVALVLHASYGHPFDPLPVQVLSHYRSGGAQE